MHNYRKKKTNNNHCFRIDRRIQDGGWSLKSWRATFPTYDSREIYATYKTLAKFHIWKLKRQFFRILRLFFTVYRFLANKRAGFFLVNWKQTTSKSLLCCRCCYRSNAERCRNVWSLNFVPLLFQLRCCRHEKSSQLPGRLIAQDYSIRGF